MAVVSKLSATSIMCNLNEDELLMSGAKVNEGHASHAVDLPTERLNCGFKKSSVWRQNCIRPHGLELAFSVISRQLAVN
jgi:hypothetical protein